MSPIGFTAAYVLSTVNLSALSGQKIVFNTDYRLTQVKIIAERWEHSEIL